MKISLPKDHNPSLSSDSPTDKKLVPISEAAKILGVSIDTIRRWDKKGILHPHRPDGKNRYFSIEELEKLKFSQPMSISQVAKHLDISASTLRRLEKKGLIKPARNEAGERVYDQESLEKFLHGEYFLRQKKIESKILEPLATPRAEEQLPQAEPHNPPAQKVLMMMQQQTSQQVSRLLNFRKVFFASGLFLATTFVLLVLIITALFILFPLETAKFFGYRIKPIPTLTGTKPPVLAGSVGRGRIIDESSQVLGAHYVPPQNDQGQILGVFFKPVSQISLQIVKAVSPQTYHKVVPGSLIKDINDVLTINNGGDLETLYNLTFPAANYLKIPDQELIQNLNADYLRGKIPGSKAGDLAVFAEGGTIEGLVDKIGITSIKSDSARLTVKTTDNVSKLNLDLAGITADISKDSVTSDTIKDGAVTNSKLSQITDANKVAGSAVQLVSGGGLTNSSGLTLLTSCSSSQVLAWNGSSWACSSSSSGGVTSVNSLTGALTIAAGGINAVSASGTTVTVTATEADTLATVTGRGATTTTSVAVNGGLTSSSATPITLSSTSPAISIGNTGTLSITDGSNTLLSLADAGTTGTLTVNSAKISGLTTQNGVLYLSDTAGMVNETSVNATASTLCLTQVSSGTPSWGTCSGSSGISGSGASGQITYWTSSSATSGNYNFYFDATNSRVGIGTSNPTQTLQINATNSNPFVVTSTGNVGINTTSPGGSLVVASGNVGVGVTTPSSLFAVGSGNSANFTVSSLGNVGVGASLTTTSLDYASGGLRVNGLSDLTGNVGIGQSLTVSSGAVLGSSLLVNGNTNLSTLNASGNVGVGSSLTVSSGAVLSGGLVVNGGSVTLPSSVITNANLINSSITVSATAGTGISVSGSPVSLGGSLTLSGIDASTSVKGVASFNSTNFSVTSGAVNTIQDIVTTASPSFAGLTLSGNNAALSFTGTTPSLTSGANSFSIFSGGNVGIGTSGSLYGALTVKGKGTSTGITLQTYSSNLTQGLTVLDNGNVGVGTTNPNFNLQVVSTANFGNVGVGGSLVTSGNVGVGQSLNVTDLGVFNKGLQVSGLSNLTGNVGIGQSLTVNSNLTLSGQTNCTNLTNGGKLTTDASGNVFCAADTSGSSLSGGVANMAAIWQSASSLGIGLLFDNGANVGIGTSAPLARFDVRGAASGANLALLTRGTGATNQFGLAVTDAGNVGIGYTIAPANGLAISGNVGIGITTANSNLSINGNEHIGSIYQGISAPTDGLFVDGNVGIGATTSTNKLDVWGNERVAGTSTIDSTLSVGGVTTLSAANAALSFTGSTPSLTSGSSVFGLFAGGNVGVGTTGSVYGALTVEGTGTSTGITLQTYGSNLKQGLTVLDNGNVGIGTTSTSTLVEIKGSSPAVSITGTESGNARYTVQESSGNLVFKNQSSAATKRYAFQANTSTFDLFTIDEAGNVGVGVTSPGAGFAVKTNAIIGWGNASSIAAPTTGLSISGNVGIGATTANNNLTVVGNGAFGSGFANISAPTNGLIVQGNVGIGVSAPSYHLDVSGGARFGCGDTVWNTGPVTSCSDVAEVYQSDGTVGPGDIITIGTANLVTKSTLAYQKNIIGVYSTSPGLLVGGQTILGSNANLESGQIPVALSGRVPVKVSNENGPINPGDYLTSSSVPGVAMKATKAGPVIGNALESFDGRQSQGQILVFVKTGYFNGLQADLSQMLRFADQKPVDLSNLSEITTDRLLAALEIITPKITVDTLTVNKIKANQIEGLQVDALEQLSSLSGPTASLSALLTQASASARLTDKFVFDGSGLKLLTELKVEQGAEITLDLKVIGRLTAEKGLTVNGPAEFKQQSIFEALVDFLGKVIFEGDVNFEGRPTFNKDTAGRAVVKRNSAKVEVVFDREYADIPVVNVSIALNSQINPQASLADHLLEQASQSAVERQILDGNIRYLVTNISTKGFSVKLNQAAPADITFSWTALAVKDPKTAVGSEPDTLGWSSPVSSDSAKVNLATASASPAPASASAVVAAPLIKISQNELGFLRVRSEANNLSAEVGRVLPDQTFVVLAQKDGWYEIEYQKDFYGWVSGVYVTTL